MRTSAEVVNATLLEVFLAFVFVVLSVAWLESVRATRNEAKAQRADSLQMDLDSLARQLAFAATAESLLIDSISKLHARLFVGPFAPPCEPSARPRQLVDITMQEPGRLHMLFHRPGFGYRAGERRVLTLDEFAVALRPLLDSSRGSGCRFIARVADSERLSKEEFKRSLRAVQGVFYTFGELR